MSILAAVPILAFLYKDETVSFYRLLGFEVNDVWEDYLITCRDGVDIHLWKCQDPEIPKNTGCYVRVSDIEALYQECKMLNVIHPNGDLEDKPWGMRQFSVLDNSGNLLHFGQELETKN